uniref:Reverse transcriptase domain-containing protein n=1 Tax=Tanacetum cinerariifolium TaxID=118510 RepID=A0A699I1L0_TANCI|nr:hypothetical protein [Tanacetum cinerariifolium]
MPKGAESSIIQDEKAPSRLFSINPPSRQICLSPPTSEKRDDEDERLLSIFKQIHINLPFLEAMIHMPKGAKLSLRVRNETITFNIGKSMKSKHSRDDYLYCADHTAKLIREQWVYTIDHDRKWAEVEEEGNSNEENNQLPVVISSALSAFEKARLLKFLKNHKGTIAWSIADIKWIYSSFYTHKILMEDEFKPSVQPQRRVNPNIKEVVKKEVIKLFDAGLIYPISDSPWRCMTSIFHELIEDSMKVFMDYLSVFGNSFEHCLKNLEKMLKICEETNLMLNWEKYHFMLKEGIVLGHKVSGSGIKIRDKKGAKNLAIDYLSRVENPYLGKLTKAKIRDLFPKQRVMTVSNNDNETWYADYAIVYVSKWVKAQAFPTNDARNVVNFLKKLFARFRIPKALISDRGTYFCNYQIERAMKRIIYGKACHIPIELEHKAYWVIKNSNMHLTKAKVNQFLQINELDEMRLDAYESSISYKERTKKWHDKRIKTPINHEKGNKILLFNSHLRLFSRKLKSRWYEPFLVSKDLKNGAIELYDEDGNEFVVNKQRVKLYQKDVLEADKHDDITLDDEGEVT